MIKTIKIDGRDINFKSTGGTLIRYRNQFNSEFLTDLQKLTNYDKTNLTGFSTEVIERMIWVLAKTADDSIPEPLNWYDSFDSFPIIEIWQELQDLVNASFRGLRKNA